MVGGPAIVFHRHAEKDKTKIRKRQYSEAAKPVQKVFGYDANALYFWALSQPMPVGLYTTWIPEGDRLAPHKSWCAADEWLAWLTHQRRFTAFQTHFDEGEKHLGPKQLPVDGYNAATHTACKYHSCYWHGH